MKNALLLIIATLFVGFATAQNDQYHNAMSDAIIAMNQAKSVTEFQNAANTFDRIGQVATSEWLPPYYSAYTNMTAGWISLQNEEYKNYDKYISASQEAVKKAKEIAPDQAEIYILEAYLYQAKIMRNPMINGPRFSSTIEKLLNQAKEMDPNNPRAYYLLGQQWLNMPAFFGGGKDKAIPAFETAAKKFDSFQLASDLHPNWGAKANASILSRLRG